MSFTPFLHPTYLLAALLAITVHEFAHALVAKRLGDDTAEHLGRLTLNPLAHLDPLGSLLFVLVGFGWAKPVPVDPRRLGAPTRDMALVSLAGPVSNLLLAALAFVLLHLLFVGGSFSLGQLLTGGRGTEGVLLTVLQQFLSYSLFVNLALMAFNLLPLAPLDGSKIVTPFVPWEYRRQYDDLLLQGPYILFGLLILGDILGVPLISWWVSFWADLALQIFSLLTPWW